MKITVICDKSGDIQSVAILNPAPSGRFHVEAEGGGAVHELEVDEREIEREALLGRKGAEAQQRIYQKLRHRLGGA